MRRRSTTPPRGEAGFTLIELAVTVSVAVILMSVAAPSFSEFQRNAELTTTANQIVASINAARGEAMKRGANAFVMPTDGSQWANGWRVFVDVDRDNAYGSGDVLISESASPPAYLTLSGSGAAAATPPHLMFDASGYSRQIGAGFATSTLQLVRADVSDSAAPAQTRRIKISSAGRVRVCKPSSASDTSCAASGD